MKESQVWKLQGLFRPKLWNMHNINSTISFGKVGQEYQPLGLIPNQRLRPNRDVANLALSSVIRT